MLNAIILAGDSGNSAIQGSGSKALIRIRDRFMIEYIIDSLRGAKCIEKIIVVGNKKLLQDSVGGRVDAVLEGGDSIIINTRKGIDFFSETKHVLVCTSDIPMVSSEAIDDFADQCIKESIDVGYPIIDKSLNDVKYPDVKRTYVKMKDGTYTGGNIMYINPGIVERLYEAAEGLVENRKNAIKMSRTFGIWTLLKLSMGILTIESVESRVRKQFGINAKAIKTKYPEIGNDVDKAADVDFVNKYMNLGA